MGANNGDATVIKRIEKLKSIVRQFAGKKIMVLGDLMMDEYIWGESTRLSPEAPVPVVHFRRQDKIPGGAFNVVNNLHRLGAKVHVVGKIGHDAVGSEILDYLDKKDIDNQGLIVSENMPTIIKTRILAGTQQVVRLDKEDIQDLLTEEIDHVLKYSDSVIKDLDAVIISDYAKGMIHEKLLKKVISLAQKHGVPVTVDPQVKNFFYYKGVNTLTPNHHEAAGALGKRIETEEEFIEAGDKLLKRLKSDSLLITRGKEGMSLFWADGHHARIPTVAKKVFDVTGAGDTVISVLTLALACSAPLKDAAVLANIAAGYVVGEVGTATIPRNILLRNIKPDYLH
jgi:D-beta-D-heptose 7-phosphate kinase/D-beta-D-heptose 1-phosphate adenosyltransferase